MFPRALGMEAAAFLWAVLPSVSWGGGVWAQGALQENERQAQAPTLTRSYRDSKH